MDAIFKEEQQHLNATVNKIRKIADDAKKEASLIGTQTAVHKSVDHYDDVVQRDNIAKEKEYIKKFELYTSYLPEPYFGRIDLDVDNSSQVEKYYIGKNLIFDDQFYQLVVDWRSDVGNIYYATNQSEFDINGYKYSLALKRNFTIKNSQLKNYSDAYNISDISLDGDVIDPFLLTVLKDKRRQKHLTDIIKTIQNNQNDIIRKPINENFIVQGCAGSGKTMILLHRLSYLIFNNRNLNLDRIKIITPNKLFDNHIDALSIELGLNQIQKMSVEEDYVNLIKSFNTSVTADANVYSEKALDPDLLEFLYSEDYFDYLKEGYDNFWEATLNTINISDLRDKFISSGTNFPDISEHSFDTYTALNQGLSKLVSDIDEKEKSIEELKNVLENYRKEIPKALTELDNAKANLANEISDAILNIDLEIEKNTDIINQTKNYLNSLSTDVGKMNSQLAYMREDQQNTVNELILLDNNKSIYTDFALFNSVNDAISAFIFKNLSEQISNINLLNETLKKTAVYNFSKRNSLKKAIANEITSFSRSASELLEKFSVSAHDKIRKLEDNITALLSDYNAKTVELQKYKSVESNALFRDSVLNKCKNLFNSTDIPDLKSSLPESEYAEITIILNKYLSSFYAVSSAEAKYTSLLNSFDIASKQWDKVSSFNADILKNQLQSISATVKTLSFNEIYQNFLIDELKEHYKNYNQEFTNHNYRHKIILKLVLCSFYFRTRFTKDNFINIDEAQDLSVTEYRLLKDILGPNAIFNLYGDINQLVYSV